MQIQKYTFLYQQLAQISPINMAEFELRPYPGNLPPLGDVRITVEPDGEHEDKTPDTNKVKHFSTSVSV